MMSITALPFTPACRWNRWTGVYLHAAAVGITALSLYIGENPSFTLMLGGGLTFITYLILAWMEGRQVPIWFSPLSYYFLWYSLGQGLSAIYIGSITVSGAFVSFSPPKVSPADVAFGYVIYLGGALALHIGLQWFRPSREESPENKSDLRSGHFFLLVVLWALGLWAIWDPAWIVPLGAPGRIFQWASLAALCQFTLTGRKPFRLSRPAFIAVLTIGTVGLFVVNMMAYSKAALMLSFFPVMWLFIIKRPLRRWLPLLGAALAVFYLFVLAPIVMTARLAPLERGESPAERLVKIFQVWGTVGLETDGTSILSVQTDSFLMRQFDPIAISYLIGEVETFGLQRGATMAYVAYAFIPRILWPEKPTVTRGAWFAYYVGFAPSEAESTMSLGITATGELYWNYGVPAVLVGMFGIGCLMGGLWRMAGADPRRHPLHMLLYILVTINIVNMAEAVTVLVSIVVTYLTFKAAFFAMNLFQQPNRRAYAAIAP